MSTQRALLVDKPLIQYSIEEAVQSGIKDITVITDRSQSTVEHHFNVSSELERILEERGNTDELAAVNEISSMARLSYVHQGQALGLGHAIMMAREQVGWEPFAVVLGDDVIDSKTPCLKQMSDLFIKLHFSIIATCRVPLDDVSQYGIIKGHPVEGYDGRIYQIEDLIEKPEPGNAPSDLAVIGRYLLTPEIFPALEKTGPGRGGEIQLTDAIRALLTQQPVYAFMFEGNRYDAGNKLGFLKATVHFASRHKELGADFRHYLRPLNH